MDVQSRGILITTAGFLFASFGFVLSILGAIFDQVARNEVIAQFTRKKDSPVPSLRVQGRRLGVRKPLTVEHRHGILQNNSIRIQSSNAFSESGVNHAIYITESSELPLPKITIHQPDHTVLPISQKVSLSGTFQPQNRTERSASVTFVDPPNPIIRPDGRAGLPHLGTKLRPTLSRCSSSPQLTTPPPLLPPPPMAGTKPPPMIVILDSSPSPASPKSEIKAKTLRILRKVPSAPGPNILTAEKLELTRRAFVGFTRNVEKKRSQTLRTQPYEAPYFCARPDTGFVRPELLQTERKPHTPRSSSKPKKVKT